MKFQQGRALVIGIADYEEVGGLPAAVTNDAGDTADTLTSETYCGYPDENVTVLTDGQATLDRIRQALAKLAADAQPDDAVAIFFSGHGARIGKGVDAMSALVPHDCKLSDVPGTTLGQTEFTKAIAAIKAARVIVVIDACHAAGAATLKAVLNDDGLNEGFDEKALSALATGTGRVVLASSRATETSLVLRGERNSVFTTAMLSGLKGEAPASTDGMIKVFDLFNYVSETVRQAVPGRQHPVFKASDLEENFPVALALGGAKSALSPGGGAGSGRSLEQTLADLFPAGPAEQDIWLRAGGDLSRLKLNGTGRSQWFSALRTLGQGGGGAGISRESLIDAALDEFPNHRDLKVLR